MAEGAPMPSQAGLLHRAFRKFRSQRMRLFERTFRISPRTRVLDVGGSPLIWEFAAVRPELTILNLPTALEPLANSATLVSGDACRLPFEDGSFDIVFSNSVIEHVGTRADQQRFAAEAARVGRCYWVQTPNRRFPLELHVMLPLVHYLPKAWQQPIVERFTVWQLIAHPSKAQRKFYVEHFLNDLNLLSKRELQGLFPDGQIIAERFFGWPKSLIAVRGASGR